LADPVVIEEQCQVCWPPSLPPCGCGCWALLFMGVCQCAGLQLDTCGYW
jgi:hypothetical protein